MSHSKGPRPDTAIKYQKAVALIEKGYTKRDACKQAGISHSTYCYIKRKFGKAALAPVSGNAPMKVTVVSKQKRKASSRLALLSVTDTPALDDREVTVALFKMPVSVITGWFR